MSILVQTTADDEKLKSLRDLDADHGRWKLVREFAGDSINDASRLALQLRDAGRFNGGARPIVRVRNTAAKVMVHGQEKIEARTELIMQRLAYRTRKSHAA